MIRKMTQTDYQKIFDLWKSTDRMGLRSLDDSQQGIATKLVETVICTLQKERITRVCLNVMETNEYGKSFWEKRGWEKKDFLGFYSKSITDKENVPLFDTK